MIQELNLTNSTEQKKKFSFKGFFSKCDYIFSPDFVTFSEELLNGKLHFLQCLMAYLLVK